jgi:hypothetical protein
MRARIMSVRATPVYFLFLVNLVKVRRYGGCGGSCLRLFFRFARFTRFTRIASALPDLPDLPPPRGGGCLKCFKRVSYDQKFKRLFELLIVKTTFSCVVILGKTGQIYQGIINLSSIHNYFFPLLTGKHIKCF